MEFRTLHYFLTVAQERNITRAAEKLHMAQPPLTRQIKRLEEELGVPLLIRGGRQLQLTEEGRFLQARGREILQLMENTQQQLGQLGPAQYGTIRLCTTEVSGATLLSERMETGPNAAIHSANTALRAESGAFIIRCSSVKYSASAFSDFLANAGWWYLTKPHIRAACTAAERCALSGASGSTNAARASSVEGD